MDRDELLKIIGDGKFFSAEFTKADGTTRHLRGRLGVTKGLKGGQKRFSDADKNIITVWDVDKKAYRSFRVDRLHNVKAHGREIKS